MATQRHGFTLLEAMIVGALIGILAVLAVPYAVRSRQAAQRSKCADNRRLITSAKEQFGIEMGLPRNVEPIPSELSPYFRRPKFPKCPACEVPYRIGTLDEPPLCSLPDHQTPEEAALAATL